jgi:hypothetical protein
MGRVRVFPAWMFAVLALGLTAVTGAADTGDLVAAELAGTDFAGGANALFGDLKDGESVNYVYAQSTGGHSTMEATATVARLTADPMFLHVKGRDDDAAGTCSIEITLNGTRIFSGANAFPSKGWATRKFAIPPGALRTGPNTIVITNTEREGKPGMPPWFMVAGCAIATETYTPRRDVTRDFYVPLPAEKKQIPQPLATGKEPGFRIRGTKGWMWKPEQYMAEIPFLVRYKMNFLMNCYTSMCDIENVPWGNPNCNRWWEPLPDSKKAAYEKIVRTCQQQGIQFCFSMNPNLSSSRFVNSGKPEDVDALWQHYSWMQGLGVKWFNISLDDITQGIDATAQAHVVNEIWSRLKAKDPEAQFIFCPTFYWGDGTDAKARPYLETLAKELDKDIYLFWTGDAVVGNITRKGADTYKGIVKHRLILWDNYPVNDGHPTMHLGPVINRDADLCEVIDGYMSNPHCTQSEINRIPLLTCADYAYNPWDYDPARSIGQAILDQTEDKDGREVLRDLVEAYPGMLIYASSATSFNAVREKVAQITTRQHSRQLLTAYIEYLERLAARLDKAFPEHYAAEKKTLRDDIKFARQRAEAKYGE